MKISGVFGWRMDPYHEIPFHQKKSSDNQLEDPVDRKSNPSFCLEPIWNFVSSRLNPFYVEKNSSSKEILSIAVHNRFSATLPLLIFQKIFSYCSPSTLSACSQSCKPFAQLAQKEFAKRKRLLTGSTRSIEKDFVAFRMMYQQLPHLISYQLIPSVQTTASGLSVKTASLSKELLLQSTERMLLCSSEDELLTTCSNQNLYKKELQPWKEAVLHAIYQKNSPSEPPVQEVIKPLFFSIKYRERKLTTFLLSRRPLWQATDFPRGEDSLLLLAAETNDVEGAEELINHNHPLNDQGREGKTALLLAIEQNNSELAQLLLILGADPNLSDNWQQTPLYYAVNGLTFSMIQSLLEHRGDPNQVTLYGKTVLHWLLSDWEATLINSESHATIFELLLQHGADPTIPATYSKKTVLGMANGYWFWDEPKKLLERHAAIRFVGNAHAH